MAKFDVFVGRKQETALIDAWAHRWDTTHLIGVHGDGGVGKTWLLLETQRRYRDRDDFVVLYIDAAEQPFSAQYLTRLLVDRLGPENFPRLLGGLEELSRSYFDLPRLDHEAAEREVLLAGVEEINQQLTTRRLLFLADTQEVWDYRSGPDRLGREISIYTRLFTNALLISAGRTVRQRLPEYQEDYGAQNVTLVELQDFDQVESQEFFAAADKEDAISADVRDKLHFLTNGRPVLLSLAVAWLSQAVPLPEIIEQSLAELQALDGEALAALRDKFEFELVNQVRGLKHLLDRAALTLAYITRRGNAPILSTLLDIPLPQAQALERGLIELPFMRHNPTTNNFMLHDEMKNLVNEHVWAYVDPSGETRRKLARQVISGYYEPRLDELAQQFRAGLEPDRGPIRRATIGDAEWEQWRLETECLYYHLQVDEQEGIAYFDDRFTQAQRNHHLVRMQFLLNEMELAGQPGIRDTLELRRAEALRLEGQVEQAARICRDMLAQADLSSDNRVSAHNILGLIAADTDPDASRRHYESALALARAEEKTTVLGVLHNNLGRLYRLASRLDQAIAHYRQAIEYSRQASNQPLLASATNNLAYVYRLQGDLAQADVLCRVALAQRKQMGLERDLAYSYLTKGEIDRDRGDLESAERFTKLALRSFDKVDEIRGQITAYGALANIRRHMYQYEAAEAYLERGIALAEEIRDEPGLADLLNVYGREQRDRALYVQESGDGETAEALFASAERYLERSLNLAQGYGDPWLITRSRFELALAHFYAGSRSDAYLIEQLDGIWETANDLGYWLLQGYVQEARGEIAQRQGRYGAAARYYGLAARSVAQGRGREPARFFDRLSERLLDPDLDAPSAHDLAQGILDAIVDAATDESLQTMQMLCRQVLELHAP